MSKDEAMTPEQAQANWKSQVEKQGKLYPDCIKKEFTFTQLEMRWILKIATIEILIMEAKKISKGLIDDILNNLVLPRIGLTPSEDKHILFEPTLGRFVIWLPKEDKKKEDDVMSAEEMTRLSTTLDYDELS